MWAFGQSRPTPNTAIQLVDDRLGLEDEAVIWNSYWIL